MKYALASTVSDGLLCKDGGELMVLTELSFNDEAEYQMSIVKFNTEDDANEYIRARGYWALEVVKI